jgi:hypothetical protein
MRLLVMNVARCISYWLMNEQWLRTEEDCAAQSLEDMLGQMR